MAQDVAAPHTRGMVPGRVRIMSGWSRRDWAVEDEVRCFPRLWG